MQSVLTPIALILAGLFIALGPALRRPLRNLAGKIGQGFLAYRSARGTSWICGGTNKGPGCRPVTAELSGDGG